MMIKHNSFCAFSRITYTYTYICIYPSAATGIAPSKWRSIEPLQRALFCVPNSVQGRPVEPHWIDSATQLSNHLSFWGDLVSYNKKHNHVNNEESGEDNNISWNCGEENDEGRIVLGCPLPSFFLVGFFGMEFQCAAMFQNLQISHTQTFLSRAFPLRELVQRIRWITTRNDWISGHVLMPWSDLLDRSNEENGCAEAARSAVARLHHKASTDFHHQEQELILHSMHLHAVMIAGLTWFQVFQDTQVFWKKNIYSIYIYSYIFFLLQCLLLRSSMNSLTIRMVILVFAAEDAKHALGPVPLCRNADGYFRGWVSEHMETQFLGDADAFLTSNGHSCHSCFEVLRMEFSRTTLVNTFVV